MAPRSCTEEPYVTGTFGVGGSRESTPTSNQVDRRPSAPRSFVPRTVVTDGPITSTAPTRPVLLRVSLMSLSGPLTFSADTSALPVTGVGPQLWYGDSVSYGSVTETRYGTALPPQFAFDSVLPPDVEKKYVYATLPP